MNWFVSQLKNGKARATRSGMFASVGNVRIFSASVGLQTIKSCHDSRELQFLELQKESYKMRRQRA